MNVNKNDFIHQLIEKHNYTKSSATNLVEDFLSLLTENMEMGNTVFFYGFGCFDILERKKRIGINPQTKEPCPIPAHWVPRFYPGNALKRAVKKWEDNKKRGRN